jgi:transcriptional regulator with XRE-family HTH domain
VNTTTARRAQIVASLQDKEYREIFNEEEIDTTLPFQIRAMREARHWSQQELADRVGMTQESISRLENLDTGSYSVKTLKRLAAVFDVALLVRFAPFSELVDWAANISEEALAVPEFARDTDLVVAPALATTIAGVYWAGRCSVDPWSPFVLQENQRTPSQSTWQSTWTIVTEANATTIAAEPFTITTEKAQTSVVKPVAASTGDGDADHYRMAAD